jgi:hypothetical protein
MINEPSPANRRQFLLRQLAVYARLLDATDIETAPRAILFIRLMTRKVKCRSRSLDLADAQRRLGEWSKRFFQPGTSADQDSNKGHNDHERTDSTCADVPG